MFKIRHNEQERCENLITNLLRDANTDMIFIEKASQDHEVEGQPFIDLLNHFIDKFIYHNASNARFLTLFTVE